MKKLWKVKAPVVPVELDPQWWSKSNRPKKWPWSSVTRRAQSWEHLVLRTFKASKPLRTQLNLPTCIDKWKDVLLYVSHINKTVFDKQDSISWIRKVSFRKCAQTGWVGLENDLNKNHTLNSNPAEISHEQIHSFKRSNT